jgi:hypothetical protein
VLECRPIGARRVVGVLTRSTGAVAIVVVGAVLSLFGCDDTAEWFAKPLNPLNNNPGYTYSSLGDARVDRAITANDLVDANGACPNYAPPRASPGAGEGASLQDGAALFGGGVALGMSECDIVVRLGQATAVNFGTAAYGSRSLVLTYNAGPGRASIDSKTGASWKWIVSRGCRRRQRRRRPRKNRRSLVKPRAATDRDRSRSEAGTTSEQVMCARQVRLHSEVSICCKYQRRQ